MHEHSANASGLGRLRLLGAWSLQVDGADVELGRREQRLVALLALTERSARSQVAGLLWPDSTDERALASLRRAVLQTQQRRPGLLRVDRATVRLDPSVRVDVDDVRRAGDTAQRPLTEQTARDLLGVLRGDELLPGWYEDWVVHERERVDRTRVDALERIARDCLDAGHRELAIEASRAASDIEPLLESPREVSIRAHLARSDLGGASRELHRYSGVMREELGVEPSARITALLEAHLHALDAPVAIPQQRPAPPEESLADTSPPRRPSDRARTAAEPSHRPRPAAATTSAARRPAPPAVPAVPVDPPTVGGRHAVALLVAFMVLALSTSLVIAVAGPERRVEEPTLSSEARGPVRSPRPSRVPAPVRAAPAPEIAVHPVDAAAGRAAFAVRATRHPTTVRLVLHLSAGLRVVRSLVVRGPGGNRVVVADLDPGRYRWSATSPETDALRGRVSVTPTPVGVTQTRDAVTTGAATTTSASSVADQPAPTPSSTPVSAPEPTPEPISRPTRQPRPDPHTTPKPTATSRPPPTGTPSDPGTVAPPPVG